jgi:hypothetical protein
MSVTDERMKCEKKQNVRINLGASLHPGIEVATME